MTYRTKVVVCSEIRAKRSMQSGHHVEFFIGNLLMPTGYVMNRQLNIQQLYILPPLYLCVLYLSELKQHWNSEAKPGYWRKERNNV